MEPAGVPTVDNIEGDFFVFRVVSPSSGLAGPYDTIASIRHLLGPNEIVD
jgi:hypothetical protein